MTGPNPLDLAADRLNVPLLRKAVEWAEAEAAKPPGEFREWDQGFWGYVTACGTTYCIAGYVCQVTGHEWRKDGDRPDELTCGDNDYPSDVAREELGISRDDASELFWGGNDIDDIRRIAEDIAGGSL